MEILPSTKTVRKSWKIHQLSNKGTTNPHPRNFQRMEPQQPHQFASSEHLFRPFFRCKMLNFRGVPMIGKFSSPGYQRVFSAWFFSGKPFRTFATSSNSKLEKTNWWPLDFWTMKRMILVDDVWAHSLAPVMIYQGDAPSPFMTCCYPRSIQLQDEVVGRSTKCTLGASWLVLLGGLGGHIVLSMIARRRGSHPGLTCCITPSFMRRRFELSIECRYAGPSRYSISKILDE